MYYTQKPPIHCNAIPPRFGPSFIQSAPSPSTDFISIRLSTKQIESNSSPNLSHVMAFAWFYFTAPVVFYRCSSFHALVIELLRNVTFKLYSLALIVISLLRYWGFPSLHWIFGVFVSPRFIQSLRLGQWFEKTLCWKATCQIIVL